MEPNAIFCTSCGERIDHDYFSRCCGCGNLFCFGHTTLFTDPDTEGEEQRVCTECYGVWIRLCQARRLSHLAGLSEQTHVYARYLASLSGPGPKLPRPGSQSVS